jgi:hypothetical protein
MKESFQVFRCTFYRIGRLLEPIMDQLTRSLIFQPVETDR